MPAVKGTPLTRHGSRVPAIPAPPASVPAAPSARAQATGSRPPVTPAPTIATMVICLPDDLPVQALTSHQLATHFGFTGTLTTLYWAVPRLRLWQRRQLIGARTGHPTPCAGGPLRLLDLPGLRHAVAVGAGIRYQIWQRAWYASISLLDDDTYEVERRDAQQRIHDLTIETDRGHIAKDLTTWLAGRHYPNRRA